MSKIKFIKTTLVDAITGIPCTEAPTRNGHTLPEGVTFIFDIEDSRIPSSQPWSTPDVYGTVEGNVPQHCQEIDEESFWNIFKQEILDRAQKKRKQVELGGIYVGDVFIKTDEDDQNKISRVIERSEDAGIAEVSFKAASGFINISIEDLRGIAISIAHHVQDCFSWEASIVQAVGDLELSLDSVSEAYNIIEQINMFGADAHIPQEEEGHEEGQG